MVGTILEGFGYPYYVAVNSKLNCIFAPLKEISFHKVSQLSMQVVDPYVAKGLKSKPNIIG